MHIDSLNTFIPYREYTFLGIYFYYCGVNILSCSAGQAVRIYFLQQKLTSLTNTEVCNIQTITNTITVFSICKALSLIVNFSKKMHVFCCALSNLLSLSHDVRVRVLYSSTKFLFDTLRLRPIV